MKFHKLTIERAEDLLFGFAPHPVTTPRGLEIGGGIVYPELNFTLPPIQINDENMGVIRHHYEEIITEALERGRHLHSPGVVFEFETLIEMTRNPAIGEDLVHRMNDLCETCYARYGLKSEIRLTPNDLREFERPPRQRTSQHLNTMFELFERGARAGGNLLSIESTGGKEISDDALMMCDIRLFIFSQAVLGVRDMKMLWTGITDIARRTGTIAGGDTACGFGNTAMVLAEKKYIPKVFAAVCRVATVVRTLAAIEQGATGPDKDCAYEGPFLKAIAGIPISMEGKTAACAHLSPVGNVAAACADLWSNESVQNIRLLSGNAPTAYFEQLEYDTRLMNQAIKGGKEDIRRLQKLFVESDIHFDPQALILAPENVISISKEIVKGENEIDATRRGCLKALEIISQSIKNGSLIDDPRETEWIKMMQDDIGSIPGNESAFVESVMPVLDSGKILLREYGL
jgi:methanol--5-hydroxybenzimidazolylcobamide Co-methyltransferase